VYAEIAAARPGAVADDDCFLALEFQGGARAHLWMSALAPSTGPRWRVWGSRGALEVWGLDPRKPYIVGGGRPGDPGYGQRTAASVPCSPRAARTARGREVPLPAGRYGDFYAGMAAAIRGEAPVPVPAQAGWTCSR